MLPKSQAATYHIKSVFHNYVSTAKEERGRGDRDCKMTKWGDWFPCSVTCGEGVQKRMRQVKRTARGNGTPCEPTLEERVCYNTPCEL